MARQGLILQVTVNRLPALLVEFPDAVSGIIRKTALDVQRDAQQRAPVLTGYLKNSIAADPTPGGDQRFDWTVRVGADYGIYVEYGTRFMRAQPFLRPSAEAAWGPFQEAFRALERLVL